MHIVIFYKLVFIFFYIKSKVVDEYLGWWNQTCSVWVKNVWWQNDV